MRYGGWAHLVYITWKDGCDKTWNFHWHGACEYNETSILNENKTRKQQQLVSKECISCQQIIHSVKYVLHIVIKIHIIKRHKIYRDSRLLSTTSVILSKQSREMQSIALYVNRWVNSQQAATHDPSNINRYITHAVNKTTTATSSGGSRNWSQGWFLLSLSYPFSPFSVLPCCKAAPLNTARGFEGVL